MYRECTHTHPAPIDTHTEQHTIWEGPKRAPGLHNF